MNESIFINIDEKSVDISQGEPYNGPISTMETSPNEKDLVTNSKDDDIKDGPSHNGRPIDMMEVSPKRNYLVTYSKEDKTIVGWSVIEKKEDDNVKEDEDQKESENVKEGEDIKGDKDIKKGKEKESEYKPIKVVNVIKDNTVKVDDKGIRHMCVSDKKILAYIYNDNDDDIGKYKRCNDYFFFNL